MPHQVAAAAVTAGASLVGGALASRSNNKAAKTVDEGARRAEQIAIDNEARRRMEYDRSEAQAKAQWDAEQARLEPIRNAQNALLGQAGARLNLGALGGMQRRPAPFTGSTPAPRTLADIAGSGTINNMDMPLAEVQAAPRLSIADIGNWGSQRRAF